MAYAIARIHKQKMTNLGAVDRHNRRLVETPNVDPDGVHKRVVGDHELSTAELVKAKLDKIGISKYRKDATVAVEVVLTASPEYFRPDDPTAHGKYDHQRTKEWLKATNRFLKSKYNGLVAEATLHLDEATPHLHVIVVPAMKKERKRKQKKADREAGKPPETYVSYGLCAKEMFNRQALIDLQTDYAKALEPLGLERGQHRSKAQHQTIKRYYGIAEKAVGTINALKRSVSDLKDRLGKSLGFDSKIAHDGSQEPESTKNHSELDYDLDHTP